MDWDEVLDPASTPEEVLVEKIPAFHRSRLDDFRQFVSTSLIVSVEFIDEKEQYTLLLGPDEARCERGEMIDFPQATLRGSAGQWSRSLQLASKLVVPADAQIDRYEGRVELTEAIKSGFEQFDGVLEVAICDLPDGGPSLEFDVVLNDYRPPEWAQKAQLVVQWSDLVDLAHGRISPVQMARKTSVKGAVGLAFDIGGYLMREFDM